MPVFIFGCLSCGKTVAGTEKSCPRCGASFEDAKFECPFCGELIAPGDRTCRTCGTEFSSFSDEVSETSLIELDGEEKAPETEASQGPEPKQEEADEVVFECPVCGKQVSEGDAKCPHCGALFS
jgi:predicted RNA-binding Zn-ribbon protein involved in translation (DUF1610 family)